MDPITTSSNNMNSKINKKLPQIPVNLGRNGTTPSGKPRLFVCAVCTRAFARHEHLKRHERSHTKEKPFHCGVCARSFSRRDLLLRHAQKLHAGCDDAVKRLRRRSSRARSTATKETIKEEEDELVNDEQQRKRSRTSNDVLLFKGGRRSSFSAASGANYGSYKQINKSDEVGGQVEFSTPQLGPVDGGWMSDLSSIPGLDFLNSLDNHGASHSTTTTTTNTNTTTNNITNTNSALLNGINKYNGINGNGNGVKKSNNNNNEYIDPFSVNIKSTPNSIKSAGKKDKEDIFGYSFYDDDFQIADQMEQFHQMKLAYPKLPSTYISSPDKQSNTSLNDMELLSELEIPNYEEKILSVGYSFYESNEFALSPNKLLHQSLKNLEQNNEFDPLPDLLSNDVLFTDNLVSKVYSVLKDYPFALPSPPIPPIAQLNQFVDSFKLKFLNHYPFIHKSLLNENTMLNYSKDTESFVCLPLLIVTIGALYSNEPKLSADLYEISRRCIHVYLDSRKREDERNTTHNSPLWLVQSLVLSVFYGLFAEENDGIVLRQVNALCTLIKVSKFNLVKFDHESIEINDEYFQDYLMYQSKIRTVFMIFNISNLLTSIYEIEPFLKSKDLKCDLPDLQNFWESNNVNEFKLKCVSNSSINYILDLEKILHDMLQNNVINYKISEFGASTSMFAILQHFYFNKDQSNFSVGISPYHSNSSNLVKNFKWENLLINDSCLNIESIILKDICVIKSLQIDLSKFKTLMWDKKWGDLSIEFLNLNPKMDDLLDAVDYSVRTLTMIFINDADSSNFEKCLSLNLLFLIFNFIFIGKFLHKFEKRIIKGNINQSEFKSIPKLFSIYLKLAKFLADLEQILIKNFNYNDIESKLALKDFDPGRYTFGQAPRLLELEYPNIVNMEQVLRVVKLRLSFNILKIGEFIFELVFERMNFKCFKNLSEGLFHLRLHLESDPEK